MSVSVYTYVCTDVSVSVYTYVCTDVSVYTYVCTDVSVSVYTYVCTDVSVYTDVCAASEQVCAIHLKCGVGHCYASMPLFPFALLFLSWACLF